MFQGYVGKFIELQIWISSWVSEKIYDLQFYLNLNLLLLFPGGFYCLEDGDWGNTTEKALQLFLKDSGYDVDFKQGVRGMLGSSTFLGNLARMDSSVGTTATTSIRYPLTPWLTSRRGLWLGIFVAPKSFRVFPPRRWGQKYGAFPGILVGWRARDQARWELGQEVSHSSAELSQEPGVSSCGIQTKPLPNSTMSKCFGAASHTREPSNV